MANLYTFAVAVLLSLILTPFIRDVAVRAGLIDVPSRQKLHKEPTAKMGGIAIFLSFAASVFWLLGRREADLFYVLSGAGIILIVGFLDDVMEISPLAKIVGQVLASAVLIGNGIRIGFFPDIVSIPLTLFWMVGIMNAVNLLDGMDGMAAGVSAVMAFFFMVLAIINGNSQEALIAAALAGACLGFLRFNFHKASIFMGDTGSLFLGFVLGSLGVMSTMKSHNYMHLFFPVIILGVPIFDTTLAVLRRAVKRKPLFNADTNHFYEWLWKNKIIGYRTVVIAVYLVCVLLGLIALVIRWKYG